jgi:hypothetical protein
MDFDLFTGRVYIPSFQVSGHQGIIPLDPCLINKFSGFWILYPELY